MLRSLFILSVSATVFFSAQLARADAGATADAQWNIVQYFSDERCDLVRGATSVENYQKLRPNVLAIAAFCEPRDAKPEELFQIAETKDPTGDLIMVLHAKWVWKRDKEKARPLWEKVLKHARNDYLKTMAERYLAGQVDKDEILHLRQLSYQGLVKTGAGWKSDPRLPLEAEPDTKRSQGFANLGVNLGGQRWYPFGSISVNYSGNYERYFRDKFLNGFDNLLDVPVSFRMGANEDIVFHPFYGITLEGERHFESKYGIGVQGIAYRPEYKQYVQASVFFDRLLFSSFLPQEGTHFRFDYSWEFFPSLLNYGFKAFMEHVHAIHDFSNGTDLRFSHTDIGGRFNIRKVSSVVTYEAESGMSFRLDNVPSSFINKAGTKVRKRRNDIRFDVRPSASINLIQDLKLNFYYQFLNSSSRFGPEDVQNYNFIEHTLGLSLFTEFSNY